MKSPKEYYETYIKYATQSQREEFKPFTEDIATLVSYIKSEIQNIAATHWLGDHWGIIQLGTGVGKTKIGVFIADYFAKNHLENTIISVPRETLRDTEWPNEFRKWEKEDALNRITIECHNTTIKRKGETIDTLIVDEAHHLFAPQGIKFLKNNTFKRILMLTATIPKNKLKILKELGLPIVYSYSIEQAEEDGIVSANSRYTLEVELTEEERKAYNKIDNEITKLTELCMKDPRKPDNQLISKGKCFGLSQLVLRKQATFPGKDLNLSMRLAIAYTKTINKRKDCVYYTIAKIEAFDKLVKDLIIPNGDQAITFGEKTDIVEIIYDLYNQTDEVDLFGKFHSKLKTKERDHHLRLFREGEKKILISAKALREGMNVPSVKYGISLGGTSSELDTQQEEGRTFRWELGKHAIFINIVCKNTVEMNWLKKSYQNRKTKPKVFDDVNLLIKHIQDEEYERSRSLTLS
jgi:superfamily II DNA or RNA helicase